MPRKDPRFGRRLGGIAHEHATGRDPHPGWLPADAPDDSSMGRFHLPVYNPAEHTVPAVAAKQPVRRNGGGTFILGLAVAAAAFAAITALLRSPSRH